MLRHALVAVLLLAAPAVADDDAPIEIDKQETVEVRWILIDLLALDRDDRPVTDLTLDDFEVMVGFDRVQPRTVDLDCPAEDLAARVESIDDDPFAASRERRVVLLFDYRHMARPLDAVAGVVEQLEREGLRGMETMVASLSDGLRVHRPFTDDVREVIDAVRAMSVDPAVYRAPTGGLTERPTFDALLDLYNLMEFVPGRKAVLFFSGPFEPAGWDYDVEYRLLGAMASRTRTALYTVDTRGLRAGERLGGDPYLARLAVDTGGRFTRNTNDLARGVRRAQGEIGCRYTLGIHDPRPQEDRRKRLRVFVRRPGVTVHFPGGHVRRSRDEMQRSLAETAKIATEGFDDGGLAVDVLSMRPLSRSRWDVRVVLTTPPALASRGGDDAEWWYGGVVRTASGTTLRSFRRQIDLAEPDATGVAGSGLHHDGFRLRPGEYVFQAYAYHPTMEIPLAVRQPFVVREVPGDVPFAIEPMLVLDDGVAARGGDDGRGPAPVRPVPGRIVPEALLSEGLGIWSQVCDDDGGRRPRCRGRFDRIDRTAFVDGALEWAFRDEEGRQDLPTGRRWTFVREGSVVPGG